MKKKLIIASLSFFAVLFLWSCEKQENKIFVEGATPPVLSANKTSIPLSFATKDNEAIKLSWTNPNYKFTTGPSSQDVSYLVEIDTTGANFTNPARKAIGVSKDLSLTLTQNDLNDYLLNQLVLTPGVPHSIEMRVTASLIGSTLPLASNVLKYTVTPYAIPPKVAPPASGKLFLVGNATPGGDATGWNNPVPANQEFTKVSPTMYQLTIALNGGKSYLFLPVNGSWSAKYGFTGSNNGNNTDGDDFKAEGGDMLSPAASGTYKIVVDFQRGKWTVTKI